MINKIVAIIPARGGSKRIPRKNLIDFCGKPMIAWTIEYALKCDIFDEVVVSTDDEEIAKTAIEYGAIVPFLRQNSYDDFTPVSEATLHTINQLESIGKYYDIVIQLFPVCPLRNHDDIIDAYNFFSKSKSDFQISCFKYVWMNPWWAVKLDSNAKPESIFKNFKQTRSQDLPSLFCPTGAIWIAKINALKESKTFYGDGHTFFEMDWQRALDIDSYDDIELGKKLFNK